MNDICIQENAISTITGLSEDYLVQNTYVNAINDKSTRETCTDDFHVEDNVPDFGLMLDNEGANNPGNSEKCMEREIGLVKNTTDYQNAASSTSTLMVQNLEYGNNLQHLPADCILPECFDPTKLFGKYIDMHYTLKLQKDHLIWYFAIYHKMKNMEAKEKFMNYVKMNMEWITDFAKPLLLDKNCNFKSYFDYITQDNMNMLVDELALLLLCKCFKIHLCVLHKKGI